MFVNFQLQILLPVLYISDLPGPFSDLSSPVAYEAEGGTSPMA